MTRIGSTDDVHPRDRLAYWVDGLADAIVHVDCEPLSDEPFVAEIRADSAGEVRCARSHIGRQICLRSGCNWPGTVSGVRTDVIWSSGPAISPFTT